MDASSIPAFDVEGPVQAEVFVLWLDGRQPRLTGPCGPAPWYLEIGTHEDPVAVVTQATRRVIGEPLVSHSTSWRADRGGVILSFVVVVDATSAQTFDAVSVERSDLARSSATNAPLSIDYSQVLEHGLRHLAWLIDDDEVVAEELAVGWPEGLAAYLQEPFRNLR